MRPYTLTVCSMTEWISQDFIDADIRDWKIIKDRGFDLPLSLPGPNVAWWMPTEHAVKLCHSGLSIPFMAPGSHWLTTVPQSLTGRFTGSGSVKEVLADTALFTAGKVWIKPAEFKHQDFVAGLYDQEEIASFHLPDDSILQWTDTVMDFSEEHRFFVCEGEIIASSVYLADKVTYYDGAVSHRTKDAEDFAFYAVSLLVDNQPPAYVLDIAFDETSDRWVVLEGNPMFSSALYGADPAQVVKGLLRCANPSPDDTKWLWVPDPYLIQKYARMRPLRPSAGILP